MIRNGKRRAGFQQRGQRASYVAESEEGDPQNSIFSIRELRSDSSAARFFRSPASRSRAAAS